MASDRQSGRIGDPSRPHIFSSLGRSPLPEITERDLESAHAHPDMWTGFERVFRRTILGFCDIGTFIEAFSETPLITYRPNDDLAGLLGDWALEPDGNGFHVLEVYTSTNVAPRDANPWSQRDTVGREILEMVCPIPATRISINSTAGLSRSFLGADLAFWWAEWVRAGGLLWEVCGGKAADRNRIRRHTEAGT